MSNIVPTSRLSVSELALINNDLSKLKPEERLSLYNKTCESLGLNPLTQPFGYIEFRGGKLSLYAKKDATDQLRKIHDVSVEITSKETINDNFVVMAKAKDLTGRYDEDMGSVNIKNLSGDNLGNAMMKAITKAKRRVTLSICGLGMLDENEVDTIPDTKIKDVTPEQKPTAQPTTPLPTPKIDQQEQVKSPRKMRNFALNKYEITMSKLAIYKEIGKVPEAEAVQWINTTSKWLITPGNIAPEGLTELLQNMKDFFGII